MIGCVEEEGYGCTQINLYGAITDNVTDVINEDDPRLTKNADSKLRKRIDNDRVTLYNYDAKGNVTKIARNDGITIENAYDADGRAQRQTIKMQGTETSELSVEYKNGDALTDDRVTSSAFGIGDYAGDTVDAYDKFGRLETKLRDIYVPGQNLGVGITDTYSYAAGNGSDKTTQYISSVKHTQPGGEVTESYAYDANGNIRSVNNGHVRYAYDKLNRLTREDNEQFGKTWVIKYDAGGNILRKEEYAYTTADDPGTSQHIYNYSYHDKVKDLLTAWNGQTMYGSLNISPYPSRYKDSDLVWSNGKLYEYGPNKYEYDADNVRRNKTVGGTKTEYYYDGSRLLGEKRVNGAHKDHIRYLYDHNELTGIYFDGTPYLYAKNAQGDITGIYDVFGEVLAKYAYDAWGVCKVYNGSGALDTDPESIGNLNPFRYRGYYYDVETKLYYLINRYYDPEVGRFISHDHIGYMMEQMEQLNGCNLYAYCLNNPVMGTDPIGRFLIASLFFKAYYKRKIWGFDNKWWGRITYSTTFLSEQTKEKGFFYAYSDKNLANGDRSWGAGINAWDWFGIDLSVDSGVNLSVGVNITPWFHIGTSVGLDGITISGGVDIKGTSHDISIGIGIAPIAIVVGVAAVIFSGGQAAQPVFELFRKIFGF